MVITHRGIDVLVSEKMLNVLWTHAVANQVGCPRVSQNMGPYRLSQSGPLGRVLYDGSNGVKVQRCSHDRYEDLPGGILWMPGRPGIQPQPQVLMAFHGESHNAPLAALSQDPSPPVLQVQVVE